MSTSSSLYFLNDPSSSAVVVIREEFNAFHKIDRTLFNRLVFGLNRDMNQSSEVIGFLLLLEQIDYARNLVASLVSSPDVFVDAVANETLVCLSFLHNQDYTTFFVANNNDDHSVIPLLIRITEGRLTIRYLHKNREIFLLGMRKNLNDVCNRAFDDIFLNAERYYNEQLLALEREKIIEEMKNIRLNVQQKSPSRLSLHQGTPSRLSVQHVKAPTPTPPPSPPHVEEETNKTATETEEVDNEETVLPADDRTVFLTFSKGYPLSEAEVRDYFTRRFGEVIETILMQEVEENEQPLYARMMLKMQCASKMEEIVTERNRNKFTIDGKHVWARKYIRKNPSSSVSPSSSHV